MSVAAVPSKTQSISYAAKTNNNKTNNRTSVLVRNNNSTQNRNNNQPKQNSKPNRNNPPNEEMKEDRNKYYERIRRVEHEKLKNVTNKWHIPTSLDDLLNIRIVRNNDKQYIGFYIQCWRYRLQNTREDITDHIRKFIDALKDCCGDYVLKLAAYGNGLR
eukprot:720766_1